MKRDIHILCHSLQANLKRGIYITIIIIFCIWNVVNSIPPFEFLPYPNFTWSCQPMKP